MVIAPGTIAVYIPWLVTRWHFAPPFLGLEFTRAIGITLVLAGLPSLLDSFARFAIQGLGTPAPVAAPQHLVVSGLYKYVRNPMYISVLLLIVGQALLFANTTLLIYAVCVWFAIFLFVLLYEEPTLSARFGSDYEEYRKRTPRWIPRLPSKGA